MFQHMQSNISSVVEFQDGPKKQDFWPKINILQGNHCIFQIDIAPCTSNMQNLTFQSQF